MADSDSENSPMAPFFAALDQKRPHPPASIAHLVAAMEANDVATLNSATAMEKKRLADFKAKTAKWRRVSRRSVVDFMGGLRGHALVELMRLLANDAEAEALESYLDSRIHPIPPPPPGSLLTDVLMLILDAEEAKEAAEAAASTGPTIK